MMELRHLRYFVAVAEELHFARAAERLHMEQSPLSRAIKDLEECLGARLFERTTRNTRITWAGEVFLREAQRLLAGVDQAKASVRAAASGYQGHLRIGLSDSIAQPRLTALFSRCKDEAPDVELRLFELSIAQQIKGLNNELLDVGFTLGDGIGHGRDPEATHGASIVAEPIWQDKIALVLPVNHPLTTERKVSMAEATQHPLVVCHPEAGSGCSKQVDQLIHTANPKPKIAEEATSLSMLLTLVGAGYGIGFAIEAQVQTLQRADIVIRPLSGRAPMITTYLLRRRNILSEPLTRFVERARMVQEEQASPQKPS